MGARPGSCGAGGVKAAKAYWGDRYEHGSGVHSPRRVRARIRYELIFVYDATTSMTKEWHTFSVTQIFPRNGRVRSTEDVLAAIG
jgi:hypothetical protein